MRAGDTLAWTRECSDYPPSAGWTLKYALRASEDVAIDITASGAGTTYSIAVSSATSSPWTAGRYAWQAYVELAGVRHTLATGAMEVLPNLALGDFDARSFASRALAAVEATILGRATSGQIDTIDMMLEGRGLKRDPATLLRLRSELTLEVQRERAAEDVAAGTGAGSRYYVRFGRA